MIATEFTNQFGPSNYNKTSNRMQATFPGKFGEENKWRDFISQVHIHNIINFKKGKKITFSFPNKIN